MGDSDEEICNIVTPVIYVQNDDGDERKCTQSSGYEWKDSEVDLIRFSMIHNFDKLGVVDSSVSILVCLLYHAVKCFWVHVFM